MKNTTYKKLQNLQGDLESLWVKNQKDQIEKVIGWLGYLKKNLEAFKKFRGKFHEWEPLRIYGSISRFSKSKPTLSIRFQGQEVGELILENGSVQIKLSPIHIKTNEGYFNYTLGSSQNKTFPWAGEEGKEFRKHFAELSNQSPRSEEHQIESILNQEMEKEVEVKFSLARYCKDDPTDLKIVDTLNN